jgi:hypothetical protein
MPSHAETRANNKMYSSQAAKDLRTRERGESRPVDPVSAAKSRHRLERSSLGAEHRQEVLALRAKLDRAKISDHRRGGVDSDEGQLKALAEKHSTAMQKVTDRQHRELEDIARRHPVA